MFVDAKYKKDLEEAPAAVKFIAYTLGVVDFLMGLGFVAVTLMGAAALFGRFAALVQFFRTIFGF